MHICIVLFYLGCSIFDFIIIILIIIPEYCFQDHIKIQYLNHTMYVYN